MKRWGWLIGLVIVAIAASAGGLMVFGRVGANRYDFGGEPFKLSEATVSRLTALGRLEPAEEVIGIGGVVGDRIVSIAVHEGDRVSKSQPLVYLESHNLRQLEIEAIEQQLNEFDERRRAELALAEARIAGGRLAVEQARTNQAEIDAQ